MPKTVFDMEACDIAWCPGCGNFGILNIIKDALAELSLPQHEVVFVSGIGQAAKIPQYIKAHSTGCMGGPCLRLPLSKPVIPA